MTLPAVVTTFLTRVKDSLTTGTDLGSDVRGASQNYLRGQDMATVLELLQDALDTSVALTATGGTTTTVVDGAGTFVPGQQIGNVVVFTGNTTAALAGVEARVASNTATTLTFDEVLVAAPVAGDTFQIRGGWFDTHISELRDGNGLADSPRGSAYGDVRKVLDALVVGISRYGTRATQSLEFSGLPLDTETVTIGADTYTFQDTLTDVDGNVQIGGTVAASVANLVAHINLAAGAGTAYAASGTVNPDVTAEVDPLDPTRVLLTAKIAGAAGNTLDSTETLTNAAFNPAQITFAGGADGGTGSVPVRTVSRAGLQTAAGSTTTAVAVEYNGGTLVGDQFRGYEVTVGSEEPRRVVTSDENGVLTVNRAYTAAPSAGTAVTLSVPTSVGGVGRSKLRVHPGAQPGENKQLAYLIETLEALMDTYVLPA